MINGHWGRDATLSCTTMDHSQCLGVRERKEDKVDQSCRVLGRLTNPLPLIEKTDKNNWALTTCSSVLQSFTSATEVSLPVVCWSWFSLCEKRLPGSQQNSCCQNTTSLVTIPCMHQYVYIITFFSKHSNLYYVYFPPSWVACGLGDSYRWIPFGLIWIHEVSKKLKEKQSM